MEHYEEDQWVDYVRGLAESSLRRDLRSHLESGCPECSGMVEALRRVATVADRSFLLSDGKVAASGSPDELRTASSELVRQFMHGMADGPVAFHFDAPSYEEQLLGRDAE